MCAAPGGKTTAISILMRDEGEVIAADRSHNKVRNFQVEMLFIPCNINSAKLLFVVILDQSVTMGETDTIL